GLDEIILPYTHQDASHVYHLYVIRTTRRDELKKYLADNGIGTLIHYPIPPHLQQAYTYLGYQKGDFPLAEELAETSLSLPLWPGINQQEVLNISSQIKHFFKLC